MTTTPDPRLSRRAVLAGLGGLGGTLVLAACSSSGTTSGAAPGSSAAPKLNLAPRFDVNEYAVSGIDQRLVVSLLDPKGDTPKDLPRSVPFIVRPLEGAGANGGAGGTSAGTTPTGPSGSATTGDGTTVTVAAHADGVPVPYFPVPMRVTRPGRYELVATIGGTQASTPFQVVAPDALPLAQVGSPMRVADTPTTADARGVTPICTRKPQPCPLHDLDLRAALATGKPVALMISTPQYCQIGVCGPVLELLLEERATHPDVQFVHAEVYADPAKDPGTTAPIIATYGLNYEPALFLAGSDGIVVQRLDNVFDRTEIRAGLDQLR